MSYYNRERNIQRRRREKERQAEVQAKKAQEIRPQRPRYERREPLSANDLYNAIMRERRAGMIADLPPARDWGQHGCCKEARLRRFSLDKVVTECYVHGLVVSEPPDRARR